MMGSEMVVEEYQEMAAVYFDMMPEHQGIPGRATV